MKRLKKWGIPLLAMLLLAVFFFGGFLYIRSVKNALWTESVTDILEVTSQGRHALDTYIEKDMETLELLAADLHTVNSTDEAAINAKIRLFSNEKTACVCVDLRSATAYSNLAPESYALESGQKEEILKQQGRGIRAPFLDGRTGVWTIGVYERFLFADGVEGYVQKTQPLIEISERFSLSFYQNTGFSYVVDGQGNILIRSQHRNSNRTFHNLFDIIDLQGNDEREVALLREAMANAKMGVARFRYQQEEYVFCYVPMVTAAEWYVVSIIPNRVIMEQANNIVQHSQVLFLLIALGAFVLLAFFLLYRFSTRRILAAKEEARKAAESANVAKSRFLSNMSHDIRTPMNAIIGMTRLALNHADDPGKVREYLKNIGLSGQLLVGLINDILDMSKIESGKMILNNADASLEELLAGIVKIIQPMIRERKQNFEIRLHRVEHERLCFDVLRLNQVLINLLSNAVKFTPEAGTISLDVTEEPSLKPGCARYTFCVADTGIGMKPEFLEHIFDSFTREQDSRVNKTEGSGLGMAITKMIVDVMGGSIQVESEPGTGTTFTVGLDLPLLPDNAESPAFLPSVRVLFADDDAATCQSAEKFLLELGVTAGIAHSGKMAVEMAVAAHARKEEYSLFLIDWKMEDINGIQAIQRIREQTGSGAPAVLLSAYDWDCIETEAVAAGVTGFLQKPLFKSMLSRCIQQYVLQEDIAIALQNDQADLNGRRILIAEDNQLNRDIGREILEDVGAEVEAVENGLECVERFARSEPGYFDLILMDIHMPIMDGYEAARQIRRMNRPDAAGIPVFAMTADAFAEDIAAAKQAGMTGHLAKPLNIPAMLREIQKVLH